MKPSHIVEIVLDSDEFEELRDPRKLSAYVRAKTRRIKGECYVLIDEIQMCEDELNVAVDTCGFAPRERVGGESLARRNVQKIVKVIIRS